MASYNAKQAELQRLKMQEIALVQLLTRCNAFMNKLQVEEMQLKSILNEDDDGYVQNQTLQSSAASSLVTDSSMPASVERSTNRVPEMIFDDADPPESTIT